MSKLTTPAKRSSHSQPKGRAAEDARSRIQPAATKPVKTTLSEIRRAVRKSLKEHPAALDA